MHRFYYNSTIATNQIITLPDEIRRHINVLRLKVGSSIVLFNGDDMCVLAEIVEIQKRTTQVKIIRQLDPPTSNNNELITITLGMCLIANDKMDLIIQKATELGVAKIYPIISTFSQKIAPDKIEHKIQHWNKIVTNSCEQCGRNKLLAISTPLFLPTALDHYQMADLKIICTTPNNSYDTDYKHNFILPPTPKNIFLLIGPEGGFSNQEIDLALQKNFIPKQLGNQILRAEAACIGAISILQAQFNNWFG